jgi:hypothetical protein
VPAGNQAISTPTAASSLAAAESRLGMLMSKTTDLGTLGKSNAVHLLSVPTSSGGSCLISETADGHQGTSCVDTPLFAKEPIAWLEESDGGPDPATINYMRVVGVVKPGVDAVDVQLESGAIDAVSLTSRGAFDYEEPLSTIHAGDLPATLIVHTGGQVEHIALS